MSEDYQSQLSDTNQTSSTIVSAPHTEYPLLPVPHPGSRELPESLLVRTFRRRWRFMLIAFVGLLTAGLSLSIMYVRPKYQAVAQIHFKPRSGIDNTLLGGDVRLGYSGYVLTELGRIPRREIISAAVGNLELPKSAVNDLLPRISAVLQDRSQMVSVVVSGSSPAGLVEVANAVAQAYLDIDVLPQIKRYQDATQQLRGDLTSFRKDRQVLLDTLEGRNDDGYVRALRRQKDGLIQPLSEAKRDLSAAELDYSQAAGRLAALSASSFDSEKAKAFLAELISEDPLLEMYRSVYQTMIATSDQEKLFTETRDKFPEADSKLSKASGNKGKPITVFEQIRRGMYQRLSELKTQALAESERLRREELAEQQALVDQRERQRQAKSSFFSELRARDTQIAERITEACRLTGQVLDLESRIAAHEDELQKRADDMLPPAEPVLDEKAVAAVRLPDFRWLFISGSVLLATVLSLSGGMLVEHYDSRLTNAGDIVRRVGIPVLASLPTADDPQSDDFWLPEEMSMADYVNDQYRNIRTAVLFGQGATPELIVVTAPTAAETKTTLSVNLAISIARSGRTVLLIDADLGSPSLSDVFDLPASPGFSDVLRNPASLAQTISRTRVERLSVMPAGSHLEHSAELLSSPTGRSLFDSLAGNFEHIIIDAPPLLDCPEGRIIAALADGVICSFSARSTRSGQARQATAILEELGASVIGSVLNA
ncbi:MAG: polysaccharide biosynthesis tyrosine autokinase [Actinobacteria bacterium]|nr:polysaccharide biosynthesis tyrosine autokinase [Actinomycetota bacterium]